MVDGGWDGMQMQDWGAACSVVVLMVEVSSELQSYDSSGMAQSTTPLTSSATRRQDSGLRTE